MFIFLEESSAVVNAIQRGKIKIYKYHILMQVVVMLSNEIGLVRMIPSQRRALFSLLSCNTWQCLVALGRALSTQLGCLVLSHSSHQGMAT